MRVLEKIQGRDLELQTNTANGKKNDRKIMSTTGLTAEQEAQLAGYTDLAQKFTLAYYQAFDADRSSLIKSGLYNANALLTFEGATFVGPEAIGAKLVSMPFQVVQHIVTTVDAHPLADGSVLVMVVGQLKADNDPPHGFNQTFVLKQFGDSYQICNDIFRLVLHHG